MSRDMRFPTMWYVWPAKAQTSLRIRAVWSEPLLVAWIFYDCLATDWTSFGVSKLNRRLHRLVWVYSCQNPTLLEITCCGSYRYCTALDYVIITSSPLSVLWSAHCFSTKFDLYCTSHLQTQPHWGRRFMCGGINFSFCEALVYALHCGPIRCRVLLCLSWIFTVPIKRCKAYMG